MPVGRLPGEAGQWRAQHSAVSPIPPNPNSEVNWVLEGSLAGFFEGAFLRSGRPRGPGKALKMWGASPPTFLKAFPGPRGRPDLKNAPP